MEILSIVIALLFIAFFSGIEIAFVSANKLRVELLKEKGSTRGRIISEFNSNPSKFISTMLIGLNIALVTFASITANYLIPEKFPFLPTDDVWLLVAQTIITTFTILILGELIPKILFRVNSDQSLLIFAYPVKLFYIILSPLTGIFHALSRWLIKTIVRSEMKEARQDFSKEDLEYLVKETAVEDGKDDEADHLNSEIFEKALYLKDVKVRSCLVPRKEIQGVEVTEGLDELKKQFLDTKHSRLIVYDETIDKIIGYVHHFDLLKNPTSIRAAIRTLLVIPETMTASDLMLQFIRERRNIAVVVDEYGGTAGIITLEDLMEEIFGEIDDEHDTEDLTEKKVNDQEFIFSGRLEINYLNSEYELEIPEGEYSTLSGYLITGFEDIPEPGTTIDLDNFHIKILRSTNTTIDLVNLRIKKED